MSDRRPEMEPQLFIGIDGGDCYNHVEAEFSDLLFAVRRGVESGTIKGSVVDHEYGKLIVIPVSDGGSET